MMRSEGKSILIRGSFKRGRFEFKQQPRFPKQDRREEFSRSSSTLQVFRFILTSTSGKSIEDDRSLPSRVSWEGD
jgi:hypothetical protein